MPEFARFDTRNYPKVSTRDGYGAWSGTYEDTVEDAMDYALLERIRRIDWAATTRIADLGCGTGRTGAWLRQRTDGALDGVDLTAEMLARAQDRGIYRRLLEEDLATTELLDASYDLVTCCLVDEHLRNLQPLYANVARLLVPGGHYVHVGIHPFFVMKTGMPTHFEDAERGDIALETNIHLLSDHVKAASSAGLSLIEMHESVVGDDWVRRKPKWERHRDWPISFALVYSR